MLVSLVGLGLMLLLLHEWQPHLQSHMRRRNQEESVVHALSSDPPHASLRFLYAVAILGYLAIGLTWSLVNQLATRKQRVGRLLNVVSRYRLKVDVTVDRPDLPEQVANQVSPSACGPQQYLYREAVDGQVEAALKQWHEARRHGLHAVVGERGSGKSVLFDRVVERYQSDVPMKRLQLAVRLRDRTAALAWLAEVVGLEARPTEPEQMIEQLQALPAGVWVCEGMELAFLRSVGGFDALRALLYVMNATGERHCWFLAFHRPAWQYLTRLTALINMEVFRLVMEVAPMSESDLQKLVELRLNGSGYSADFRALVRSNPFGADADVELERTRSAFFRLLVEASSGNPSVALAMWRRCLTLGEGKQLVVHMDKVLELDVVGNLSEADLFCLTAMRMQRQLSEDELGEVTNMRPAIVRSTVKHLQQRALLEIDQHAHWAIVADQQSSVTRTLRRRHFL